MRWLDRLKGARHQEILRHVFFALGIGALGIGLLLLAERPSSSLPAEVLRSLGAAIFTVGTITIFYDYFFVRRTLVQYSKLLANARELQLEGIFPSRRDGFDDICKELKVARGSVKILCVAGTDFFEGEALKMLKELVDHNRNIQMRFLLLNYKSQAAVLRAWLEEVHHKKAQPIRDLDNEFLDPSSYPKREFLRSSLKVNFDRAKSTIYRLQGAARAPTRIALRLYKYQPSLFLVAINTSIFVAPYHWGAGPDYYKGIEAFPCIGKNVALLKLGRYSEDGITFESHFDSLWRCQLTVTVYDSVAKEVVSTTTAATDPHQQTHINSLHRALLVDE